MALQKVMVPTDAGKRKGYTEQVGPFANLRAAQHWRSQNGLDDYFAVRTIDSNLMTPDTFVKVEPRYKGAKYSLVTNSGNIYDVTVEKRNERTGRTKAELVFPLRSVLQQAIDRGPDDYIEV